MRICIIPALLALYWFPALAPERDAWRFGQNDIFVFEAEDKWALGVVTPDPFQEGGDGLHAWRAEVHVRVGGETVTEELYFLADHVSEETLLFVQTAWGPEIHILEPNPDLSPGQFTRRRWLAREDGLEEITPSERVL